MSTFFMGFAMVGVALVFFGAIAVMNWIDSQRRTRERELAHTERMRALELGQPLPDADLAQARAEASRCRTAGALGILVPLIAVGGSLIATAILLNSRSERSYEELLSGIWIGGGVVTLLTVVLSFSTLKRRRPQATDLESPEKTASRFSDSPTAVTADRPSSSPQ
jgi:hypothetical protein